MIYSAYKIENMHNYTYNIHGYENELGQFQ